MKRLTAEQKKTVIFHLQPHKSANQVSSITNIGRPSIQSIAKDSGITLQSKSPGASCYPLSKDSAPHCSQTSNWTIGYSCRGSKIDHTNHGKECLSGNCEEVLEE